ncbi:MAG: hypothetical protein ACJ8GN_21065 [Longimicrobiaceae bacterium]
MSHHHHPRRGVFLAIAALALAAAPAAAQSPCAPGNVPNSGSCTIGGYTANFASASGTIGANGVNLTGGWVYLTPTPPVTTSYAPSGVAPGLPSFLVVAYARYTAVAVVSGTMGAPAGLGAGCEAWYTNTSNGAPGPAFAISTDPGVVTILNQMGISYPTTCTQ